MSSSARRILRVEPWTVSGPQPRLPGTVSRSLGALRNLREFLEGCRRAPGERRSPEDKGQGVNVVCVLVSNLSLASDTPAQLGCLPAVEEGACEELQGLAPSAAPSALARGLQSHGALSFL